jgi:hypothetical protein
MSLDHLGILNAELPELFQHRDLTLFWDDELIIISDHCCRRASATSRVSMKATDRLNGRQSG